MKLATRIVHKPWGRTQLPPAFAVPHGESVGEIWFEDPAGDDAPLMIKYLFTSERLSVQVHPDDSQAQQRGFTRGKEECWLVLDAGPAGEVGVGLKRDATVETLHAAALSGAIEDMIDWRPARAGDFIYNDAGTIHAIGGDVIILEVQQNVDLTYRLYDYGRPRELHLDDGLAVARTSAGGSSRDRHVGTSGDALLVDGPHFGLRRIEGPGSASLKLPSPIYVVPLDGSCRVDDETVQVGECARTDDPGRVEIPAGVNVAVAWAKGGSA